MRYLVQYFLLPGIAAFSASAFAAALPVDFAAKIQPLFEEHCIDCHAADEPDGDFALHTFEALMKGGKEGRAIVPGNAQESLLVKFLEGRSGREGKNQFMPPGKRGHLSPEEIALVRQWIDAGAIPPAAPAKPVDLLAGLPKIAPRGSPRKAVQSLAFSAKTGMIAAGSYGSIQLLDGKNGRKPVRVIEGIAGKVNGLVFSPDGAWLFAAAGDAGINGVAYQWSVADGALVRKFEGHTDALYALALSPDGKWLATGSYDQKIRLWDVATGASIRVLTGHNGAVFGLSFRPDGRILASASADRTVKLWEVATGKRLDTFSQPLKEQTVVAFSPEGTTVAAGGADKRLRLWSVSEGAVEGTNKLLATRFAHEGALLNLAFSRDGRTLFSTAADSSAKIWNAQSLTEMHLMEKQPDWAPALAVLEGDKVLLGRLDGTLGGYLATTGKPEAPPMAAPVKPKSPPPKPELTRVEPRGVQSGAATRLKITGKNLAGLQSVKLGHPGLKATIVSVNPAGTLAEVEISATPEVPRTQVELSLVTAAGETAKQKLLVDYLPQVMMAGTGRPTPLERLPVNVWGSLTGVGQVDACTFTAKKGETVIFDLAAGRVDSKMMSPRLEVVDGSGKLMASSNGLDSGSDPFIAFTVPADGAYQVLVREVTLGSSPDHFYRLTAGVLPYVTGWWPLSVPPGQESVVHLVGHNLVRESVTVKAGEDGVVTLPLDAADYRSRVNMKVEVSHLPEIAEQEPNDAPDKVQTLTVPVSVNGRLLVMEGGAEADVDHFRIEMEKGQQVVIETRAAMMGSPADTKVDVLDAQGRPIPMLRMQATKDSWITLRSEDANDPAVRLGQFAEMELNDYMYFNGEVLKIYRLARGPDADMIYYAQGGKRRAYFNTSPAAHGLDDACYVVEPRPVGAPLVPNGLPVFTLNYSNDDDGERKLGRDSRLVFTAPEKAAYVLRLSDTRGWSGERFAYRLVVRPPVPDFAAALRLPAEVNLPAGTGVQFALAADREDGFEGEIRVDISGLPDGLSASSPVIIEAGHLEAGGVLFSRPGVKTGPQDFSKVALTATAVVNGVTVKKSMNPFPKVNVTAPPKRSLYLEPDVAGKPAGDGKSAPMAPYEITIEPGTTVPAWLRVHRQGDDALIGVDVENLPHGVIVDNIGLNGVQIRAGESEREIFLACAPWVPEQDRLCHMVVGSARNDAVKADAAQASFPVLLKVRKTAKAVASGASADR